LIIVYVALIEFSLPTLTYFPKLSIIFDSFISLFTDYGILFASTITVGIVSISIFLTVLLLNAFATFFIKFNLRFQKLDFLFGVVNPVSIFILIIIISNVFDNSVLAQIILIFVITMGIGKKIFKDQLNELKSEYVDIGTNIGLTNSDINKNLIYKSIQPRLIKGIFSNINLIWLSTLLYGFIAHTNGIGEIFAKLIIYNDYSGLVSLSIYCGLLILVYNIFMKFIIDKIYFWEE